MFKGLFGKLAAVLCALFVIASLSFFYVASISAAAYQSELNQKLNQDLAKNVVAQSKELSEGTINQEGLKALFHKVMATNPAIEIYLLDANGNLIGHSDPEEKVFRSKVSVAPIHKFVLGALPVLGDDPRDAATLKVFSAASIPAVKNLLPSQTAQQKFLYIVLAGQDANSIQRMVRGSYILRLAALAVLATLLVFFAIALVVFGIFTRRLNGLATIMHVFKQDKFSSTTPRYVTTAWIADEIDEFGSMFNQMADLIVEQISELRKTETTRTEFIENISHDLRKPLASLHGYIETLLLKGDGLSNENKQEYLERAMRNTKRCDKLMGDLFQLVRLDSKVSQIMREEFSLVDLIQDVIQEFEVNASEKGVTLKTEFKLPLPMVAADIALIERLMVNLVENAINHTSRGGSVVASAVPCDGRVMVEVADTGCGIAPANLSKIFNRAYQEDANRANEGHAGFGLAISKRIAEMHGSELTVKSQVNIGSTFAFYLSRADK